MVSEEVIKGKVLLVSGGTGSFGQAFIKKALLLNPKAIRIFSRGEYAQAEMRDRFKDDRLRFLIGDIRDKERLNRAMNGVDYVVHSAALKRVEICEYNPSEAHKTNVDGSENVVDAAIDNKVDKVLALSSDKAVHPINVYGVTKQHMEKIILGGNIYGDTKFSCIRSGNFQISKGNVIELWRRQLEEGKELEVTDIDMTRYWISLDEITDFALKCLSIMEGGEIFIPKMEQQELKDIINTLQKGARIKIIGKRPGEKLNELLFNEGEIPIEYDDYYLVKPERGAGN